MTFYDYCVELQKRISNRKTYKAHGTLSYQSIDYIQHRTLISGCCELQFIGSHIKLFDDMPNDWIFSSCDFENLYGNGRYFLQLSTTNRTIKQESHSTWFDIRVIVDNCIDTKYGIYGSSLDYLTLYLEAGKSPYVDIHNMETFKQLLFKTAFDILRDERELETIIEQICIENEPRWLNALNYIYDDINTYGRDTLISICDRALKRFPDMSAYIIDMFNNDNIKNRTVCDL